MAHDFEDSRRDALENALKHQDIELVDYLWKNGAGIRPTKQDIKDCKSPSDYSNRDYGLWCVEIASECESHDSLYYLLDKGMPILSCHWDVAILERKIKLLEVYSEYDAPLLGHAAKILFGGCSDQYVSSLEMFRFWDDKGWLKHELAYQHKKTCPKEHLLLPLAIEREDHDVIKYLVNKGVPNLGTYAHNILSACAYSDAKSKSYGEYWAKRMLNEDWNGLKNKIPQSKPANCAVYPSPTYLDACLEVVLESPSFSVDLAEMLLKHGANPNAIFVSNATVEGTVNTKRLIGKSLLTTSLCSEAKTNLLLKHGANPSDPVNDEIWKLLTGILTVDDAIFPTKGFEPIVPIALTYQIPTNFSSYRAKEEIQKNIAVIIPSLYRWLSKGIPNCVAALHKVILSNKLIAFKKSDTLQVKEEEAMEAALELA